MHEHSDATPGYDYALYGLYALSALVLLAVYREPIATTLRDSVRWYRANRPVPKASSIRPLTGRLWHDVREAVDNARRHD